MECIANICTWGTRVAEGKKGGGAAALAGFARQRARGRHCRPLAGPEGPSAAPPAHKKAPETSRGQRMQGEPGPFLKHPQLFCRGRKAAYSTQQAGRPRSS